MTTMVLGAVPSAAGKGVARTIVCRTKSADSVSGWAALPMSGVRNSKVRPACASHWMVDASGHET